MTDPLQYFMSDSSQVGEARRQAAVLAGHVGFDETRRGELAIVITEIGNNLVRHAQHGEMIIRSLRNPDGRVGVEVLAVDRGPGMPNLATALRDGYSSGKTPGTGLGAIGRLSGEFDIHTSSAGTVMMSRTWAADAPVRPAALQNVLEMGAVSLPLRGQEACGDAWAIEFEDGGKGQIIVADGLGHGFSAAEASRMAIEVFRDNLKLTASQKMQAIHQALRATRGAAVAILELRFNRGEIAFVGVGNIAAQLLTGSRTRNLVSHNGTAGAEMRRVQEFIEHCPDDAMLVIHSDGLSSHWHLDKYPGLLQKHPAIICGVLYRDFRRERDDATVLCVKCHAPRTTQ